VDIGVRVNRTRFEVIGGYVFLALFLSYLVWVGVVPKFRSNGSDGAVISFEVAFDEPDPGSKINTRLVGQLDVPTFLQNIAACRNGPDWMSDDTLNTTVVVATRADLIRAAELGDSGRYDWDFVGKVEQLLWNGFTATDLPELLSDEARDRNEVARYLADREQQPGQEAQAHFVAYVAARNLFGDGILRVIDITQIDREAVAAFADQALGARIYVAGANAEPRELPPSACRAASDRRSGAE
jgi:hypothetical protein